MIFHPNHSILIVVLNYNYLTEPYIRISYTGQASIFVPLPSTLINAANHECPEIRMSYLIDVRNLCC